jgi:hypothetical protein
MGRVTGRKYIEVPRDYWESSLDFKFIPKEEDAKTTKRNK